MLCSILIKQYKMKTLEKIVGIAFVISLILRFYLIPGYGILTVLLLTIIACIYYLFGFAFFNNIKLRQIFRKESYKGVSALRIIGAICAGISLATICTGTLFRLQHYPGGEINLLSGLICTLIVSIIALIKFYKNKSEYYSRIFKRIAIIGGFGLIIAITPDIIISKIQFRNHPDYIKALENYNDNPQSKELWLKKELEYRRATMSEEDFEHYKMTMEKQKD
jgi:glucan phosphoethanolaminetransferase (alkaline phosphatase superfamily)